MIEIPYCYDGCKYSKTKKGKSLIKEGTFKCDKYKEGIPFDLQNVNVSCPVAKGEEE